MRLGDSVDASELSEFAYSGGGGGPAYNGPGRWGSAHGGSTWGRTSSTAATVQQPPPSATHLHHPTANNRASYEAEDMSRHNGRPGSRPGLYYSPPGTSYTIVERPASASRPHTPHQQHYTDGKRSARGTYLGSSSVITGSTSNFHAAPGFTASTSNVAASVGSRHASGGAHGAAAKKRPISPEQVLRLFGPQGGATRSGAGAAGRRGPSPASSPPSTTHQPTTYRERPAVQQSVPNIHELCTRTVSMSRDPADGAHGFGICVKGGKDAGVGVYISRVEEGSVAERAGLRPGDSILEVNGTPFTAISHDEALKMLKSCRHLSMTVRSPPSLPVAMPSHVSIPSSHVGLPSAAAAGGLVSPGSAGPQGLGYSVRQTCSWMDRQGRPVSPPADTGRGRWSSRDRSVRRVELCIEPGQSLGLMIRGGVEYQLGIYITGVDKDSVAERAGLLIGDQILEVNGQSFLDVTHDEAVGQLKFHKRMSLVVRDVGKVPHSCTAYDNEPWDPNSPTSRQPRSPAQQMVEEKARSLLPRSEFSALCYYTQQYCCRSMTCEALVTVLREMLNTPDKLTLMTELREIILPEDRMRFDELVYRREGHVHMDPHTRRKLDLHGQSHGHDISGDAGALYGDPGLDDQVRSPSEDSGLGLQAHDRQSRTPRRSGWNQHRPTTTDLMLSNDEDTDTQNYMQDEEVTGGRGSRRHSSPGESREGSQMALHRTDYEDSCGYLEGLRSQLGGWTQRVKSWYWGRPLELAHKLSRSFDMKEDSALLGAGNGAGPNGGPVRRHQSMSRLGPPASGEAGGTPRAVSDQQGNLHVAVKKSKPILGIAIEGGANTKHPLPRIINIHENGAAFSAGGLEVGQLILEVDGRSVEGMPHQDVARLIAECFARRDTPDINFVVVEAKKSNLEPKPTALIFLEA